MPVLRVKKERNYTCVSNVYLRDPSLSLKAKGLLTLMLSIRDAEWEWSVAGLAALCRDGKDSVRKGLEELRERGHFFRCRRRLPDGTLGETEYWVFEEAQAVSPFDRPETREREERNPEVQAAEDPAEEPETDGPAEKPETGEPEPDSPVAGFPILDYPTLEKPTPEKPTQRNTESKKYQNKEIKTERKPLSVRVRDPSHLIFLPGAAEERDETEKHPPSDPPEEKESAKRKRTRSEILNELRGKTAYPGLLMNYDRELVDSVLDLMTEILTSDCEYFSVSGNRVDRDYFAERVGAFTDTTMEYLLDSLRNRSGPVRNAKKYLMACILNAPVTCRFDMDAKAAHCLYS